MYNLSDLIFMAKWQSYLAKYIASLCSIFNQRDERVALFRRMTHQHRQDWLTWNCGRSIGERHGRRICASAFGFQCQKTLPGALLSLTQQLEREVGELRLERCDLSLQMC